MMQQQRAPYYPEQHPETMNEPFVRKPHKSYVPPYFMANGASFIVAVLAMLFFFICLGGPSWYVVPPEQALVPKTFGLWRLCVRSECVVDMTNDYMVKQYLVSPAQENPEVIKAYEDFLVPVKVLMCIAAIFVLLMITANLLFIAGFPTFFTEGALQVFAGVLNGVAIALFGGNFNDKYNDAPFGWSYWVGIVSTILLIANGCVMIVISVFVYRQRGGFGRKGT